MSHIGSFGKLIFEVSDQQVLTFQRMSRTIEGVWADHELIGKKPRREFLHSACRGVDMEIKLRSSLGVKPYDMLTLIASYVENGVVYPLVIDGKPASKHYNMAILSASEEWDTVISGGKLVQATVTLTFGEVK